MILCVGESLEEREKGVTEQVLAKQLQSIKDAGVKFTSDSLVIAMEPKWAIGTGKVATAEQA